MEIQLSPSARHAAERDLAPGEMLRIAFAGGCGAMGFRLAPTRRGDAEDLRLELGAVTLLLDHMASRELDGATLDYSEEEGFSLDHPRWGISC
jgi:Fe-S cluster assembly iron-binding protein IscA